MDATAQHARRVACELESRRRVCRPPQDEVRVLAAGGSSVMALDDAETARQFGLDQRRQRRELRAQFRGHLAGGLGLFRILAEDRALQMIAQAHVEHRRQAPGRLPQDGLLRDCSVRRKRASQTPRITAAAAATAHSPVRGRGLGAAARAGPWLPSRPARAWLARPPATARACARACRVPPRTPGSSPDAAAPRGRFPPAVRG